MASIYQPQFIYLFFQQFCLVWPFTFKVIRRILNAWKTEEHRLYVLGQFDFYGFSHPSCSVGELAVWHLLIDILFVVAYLGVLTTKSQRLSWLFWGSHADLCVGYTAFVAVNYIWFFFYLSNLLIYHFRVRSLRSLHVWTFLLAQVLVVGQLLIFQEVWSWVSSLSARNYHFYRFNDFWLGSDSYCGGFERSSAKQNAR